MKRTGLSVLFAVLATVTIFGNPAYGQNTGVGGAVIVGSGTISPGLTTTPTNQTFGFTTNNLAGLPSVFFGVVENGAPPVAAGIVSCSVNGSSTGSTVLLDQNGTGSGVCNGPGTTATVTVTFTRVGPLVVLQGAGTATVNGATSTGSGVGVFIFIPTSANPTTSYQLVGATVVSGS